MVVVYIYDKLLQQAIIRIQGWLTFKTLCGFTDVLFRKTKPKVLLTWLGWSLNISNII